MVPFVPDPHGSRPVVNRVFAAFSVSLLLGCNSTGVGNPGFETQELALVTDETEVNSPADAGAQFGKTTLSRAVIVFSELRLIACDGEASQTLQGPFVVDLVENRVQPELPVLDWPQSGLCGIDGELRLAQAPDLVAGYSVFLTGEREGKGTFLVRVALEGTLPMRPAKPPVEWSPSEHVWLWALRPRHWIADSDLDEPDETDELGRRVITLSPTRHPVTFELVKTRLGERSSLHVDLDDDRQLDDAERDGPAWIGVGQPVRD